VTCPGRDAAGANFLLPIQNVEERQFESFQGTNVKLLRRIADVSKKKYIG
jgi:hypothetical protein